MIFRPYSAILRGQVFLPSPFFGMEAYQQVGGSEVKEVTGDLSRTSLLKVMEDAEANSRTGCILVVRAGVEKRFYLREGKVIFVTSDREGERFGEYLASTGCLNLERIQALIEESRRRGVRFTYDLLEEGVFQRRELEAALRQLVVVALADALNWTEGRFACEQQIPAGVLQGPINIEVAGALRLAVDFIRDAG